MHIEVSLAGKTYQTVEPAPREEKICEKAYIIIRSDQNILSKIITLEGLTDPPLKRSLKKEIIETLN